MIRIVGQVARTIIKDGDDPALLTILVGTHQTAKLYHDMLKAQGAPPTPMAETPDDALKIIRIKMAEKRD